MRVFGASAALLSGVLLLFAAVAPAAGSVTYTYTSNLFNTFTGGDPDTPSDFIRATFTVANPLFYNNNGQFNFVNPLDWTITDQATTHSSASGDSGVGYLYYWNNLDGSFAGWNFAPLSSSSTICPVYGVPCTAYPILQMDKGWPPGSSNNIDSSQIWCGGSAPCEQASVSNNPGNWTAFFNELPGGTGLEPVVLPSGVTVAGVTGTIGGLGSQDYYSFSWGGGAFSATASITGNPSGSFLFSEGVAGGCSSGGTATLDSSDSFTSTIAISNPAAGQYCIGIDNTGTGDPGFALTFNAPIPNTGAPEPATWTLSGAAFAALLFCRKRKARLDA